MLRTNIYLPREQTDAMDALASQEGVSRAEIVRRLIDQGLSRTAVVPPISAIIESFAVLGGLEVSQRGITQRDQHLNELWQS